MQVRTLVGQHDTGLFDKADAVKTTKVLGKNVDVADALKLTQENKGAEMLIEKQGADGKKAYDVYAIAVEGKEGKSVKSVDLFDNISLEKDLAKKFGGSQAIIAPENEKWATPDKDFISYFNVRPDLGKGLEGLKYSAWVAPLNLLSFATGGNGVGPWSLGQISMNERIQYEAEKAAAKPAEAASPAPHKSE